MLIEAKAQVPFGRWGIWLSKNFDLSARTASAYMSWARHHQQIGRGASEVAYSSMRQMRGDTERRREQRQSKQQQDFRRVLHDVARDLLAQIARDSDWSEQSPTVFH